MMKKTKFGCPKCNYTAKGKVEIKTDEAGDPAKRVGVINEKDSELSPVTDYPCVKCNGKKAYFWIRQMRAGDEPESKFYKCTKCKNVVRVDD